MKSFVVIAVCVAMTTAPASSQKKGGKLKSQKEMVSYIIGMDIGNNLKRSSIDVDPELFLRGLKDAMAGRKSALSDSETQRIMTVFQQEMMAKQSEKHAKLAEENKKKGEEFLKTNARKDSVVTLPDGLQYKVLVEGTGKSPTINDTVTTHYRGTLTDGTVFDSSYDRGEPATFPVTGVIKGWTEVLQLMKVGSKWRIFVPSTLAYGERGAGQRIGPNETLIFDIELIGIK